MNDLTYLLPRLQSLSNERIELIASLRGLMRVIDEARPAEPLPKWALENIWRATSLIERADAP